MHSVTGTQYTSDTYALQICPKSGRNNAVTVTTAYGDTFGHSQGCHSSRLRLHQGRRAQCQKCDYDRTFEEEVSSLMQKVSPPPPPPHFALDS